MCRAIFKALANPLTPLAVNYFRAGMCGLCVWGGSGGRSSAFLEFSSTVLFNIE